MIKSQWEYLDNLIDSIQEIFMGSFALYDAPNSTCEVYRDSELVSCHNIKNNGLVPTLARECRSKRRRYSFLVGRIRRAIFLSTYYRNPVVVLSSQCRDLRESTFLWNNEGMRHELLTKFITRHSRRALLFRR